MAVAGVSDGYCDATGFHNEGACEHDDKGAFENIYFNHKTTWEVATAVCRERCLRCTRCNFISFSLKWNDCSWFHECDVAQLRNDVVGHKSMRVRERADSVAAGTVRREQHLGLWAYLRSLPRIAPSSCWVGACSASRNQSLLAVGIRPIAHSWAVDAEAEGAYGHIWRVVESFFQCAVLESLANDDRLQHGALPLHRRLLVPAGLAHNGAMRTPFRELFTLFAGGGSRLSLVAASALPYCPPRWEEAAPGRCCHNTTVHASVSAAHGAGVHFAELREERPSNRPVHLQAMRHVVWANLGVYETQADTVLFVSNEGSSNGRRIADEAAVAAAARVAVAARRPRWRFRVQRLESLSYANELRLLRRTTMLISLFGSALHNCRFVPEGTIVLQIHGGLKGETSPGGAYLYRRVCQREMGLKWAAFAAAGWNCSGEEGLDPSDPCASAPSGGHDFTTARVPPAAFARFVSAALDGNFSTLTRRFTRVIPPHRGEEDERRRRR